MKPNQELIEEYLSNVANNEPTDAIAKRIASDPAFAQELALAIAIKKTAKAAANQERKEAFAKLGQQISHKKTNVFALPVVRWAAAASLAILIGLFWFTSVQPKSIKTEQLASNFIDQHLNQLPVLMGTTKDSLQLAVTFYNKKAYTEASQILEKLQHKQKPQSIEYAGLAALQLGQYGKATELFKLLAQQENYKSRGLLLQSLAQIKAGDRENFYKTIQLIDKKELSVEEREFLQMVAIN
jgi:tetratricopeptide (TPR) repeat protein